jgi:hypothetical protein
MISAKVDTSDLERAFSKLEREQLPFITSLAVNRTSALVRDELKATIPQVFNAPVGLTQGSVFLTKAANKRGPFERDVFLRDEASKGTPPVKYLAPETEGGPRRVKRFERALRSAGVMASNEFAYPARSYKLNAQGNIPASVVTRILSQVRASPDPEQNATKGSNRKGKRKGKVGYFAARAGGHLKPGIYHRVSNQFGPVQRPLQAVLTFSSDAPSYTTRFPFKKIAARTYAREYQEQFRIAASLTLGRGI